MLASQCHEAASMTDLKAVMLSQSITSQFSNTVNCNVYISQAVLTGTIAYEALNGKGEYQCHLLFLFCVCVCVGLLT